jgi:hypothetical protein
MNLGCCGVLAWRVGFLFQLFDLSPETLVGAERFLKGSPLKASLLDRSHDAFRLLAEVDQLAPPSGNLRVEIARWSPVGRNAQALDVLGQVLSECSDYELFDRLPADP